MLTVYCGDVRAELAAVPADSVQTVVTSPPYFGLRDYGVAAQIGLEETLGDYVASLVDVFRAIRRVLRPDGTLWLNLGDSYSAGGSRSNGYDDGRVNREQRRAAPFVPGLKPKDRMLIPARVAIALQADGWWVRDEIVWHKPNPMPSSVTDRTTSAHEMVYLLTKQARYFYDADAIREEVTGNAHSRGGRDVPAGWNAASFEQGAGRGARTAANNPRVKVPGGWDVTKGEGGHGSIHRGGRTAATYRDKTAVDPNARGLRQAPEPGEPNAFHPLGRNKRSVWTIATQPYPEAHFATFPEALVEPMILAGSRPGDVVLDPFSGSGTVAMVANRLGRKAVHVDLSEEYTAQAIKRIGESRATGDGPAIDMPVPLASDGLWAELG
jgi:DNA modification methylase